MWSDIAHYGMDHTEPDESKMTRQQASIWRLIRPIIDARAKRAELAEEKKRAAAEKRKQKADASKATASDGEETALDSKCISNDEHLQADEQQLMHRNKDKGIRIKEIKKQNKKSERETASDDTESDGGRDERDGAESEDAGCETAPSDGSRTLAPLAGPGTAPVDTEAAFDAIWAVYPNKNRRFEAQREFAQFLVGQSFVDEVIGKIKAWAASEAWTKEGGKYVPTLVHWIQRRGWDDPVPLPAKTDATSCGMSNAELDAIRDLFSSAKKED